MDKSFKKSRHKQLLRFLIKKSVYTLKENLKHCLVVLPSLYSDNNNISARKPDSISNQVNFNQRNIHTRIPSLQKFIIYTKLLNFFVPYLFKFLRLEKMTIKFIIFSQQKYLSSYCPPSELSLLCAKNFLTSENFPEKT